MKKIVLWIAFPLLAAWMVSCKDNKATHTVRFHPETLQTGNQVFTQKVEMPLSGVEFVVTKRPVLWETHILDVQMVRVATGNYGMRFTFDDFGTRELYRQSVKNRGRRMITVINGEAIGARQFDGPIADGVYYTFMELSKDELMELTTALQKNVEIVQKLEKRNKLL